MTPPIDLSRLRAKLSPQQQLSFLSESERCILLPYAVDQPKLSEDALGQRRFCQELQQRRVWIAENCSHLHWVDAIRDDSLRLTGRRFRFADAEETAAFTMRFGQSSKTLSSAPARRS